MTFWTFEPAGRLAGEVALPGDKSIAHRALIFGALARGRSTVSNLPDGDDVAATLRVLRGLGVAIASAPGGVAIIDGVAAHHDDAPGAGFREPAEPLDCHGSGTTARLLLGLLASIDGHAVLVGDASLRRRPMMRVVEPLRLMGAAIDGRDGGRLLPLTVRGARPRPTALARWESPVASAQIKSAILIAGLAADGRTVVAEPAPSRDHTERMLPHYGATVERGDDGTVAVVGPARLRARDVVVPGDVSGASFLLAAAALVPGSRVVARGISVNPGRSGFLHVLERAGARVEVVETGEVCGEPVADVTVAHAGELRAVEVAGDEVPSLIDELPLVAVLGARARGKTVVRDAAELRVKESDRIASMGRVLTPLGVDYEERPDGFEVTGPGPIRGEHRVETDDHRIAMAAAVAALAGEAGCRVEVSAGAARKSFPRFREAVAELLP